jgi:hypothetical protein
MARSLIRVAGLLLACVALPAMAEPVSAVDIVRNPSAYRDRFLTVRGTLMNPHPVVAGGVAVPAATVFDLVAGPGILVVFSPVPPACPSGSAVTVEGRFLPTATLQQQIYRNVIAASLVSCR